MKRRGKAPKEAGQKCAKESYSLPRALSEESRALALKNHDNINRRVEGSLRVQKARYEGLPALRAQLATVERDRDWLNDDIETLKGEIARLEALEDNTEHRFENQDYVSRLERMVEDLRERPGNRQYLPDRAGVIAADLELYRDAVVRDAEERLGVKA